MQGETIVFFGNFFVVMAVRTSRRSGTKNCRNEIHRAAVLCNLVGRVAVLCSLALSRKSKTLARLSMEGLVFVFPGVGLDIILCDCGRSADACTMNDRFLEMLEKS